MLLPCHPFSACYTCLTVLLQAPVTLPVEGKLVYSPHVYGPDVFGQPYFSDPSFPDNMPDIWSKHFGWVEGVAGSLCGGVRVSMP